MATRKQAHALHKKALNARVRNLKRGNLLVKLKHVKTGENSGYFEDERGKKVTGEDFMWTIEGLQKKMALSRSYVTQNIKNGNTPVHYTYFSKFVQPLVKRDFLGYDEGADVPVPRIFMSTDDVYKWFINSVTVGRRTVMPWYFDLFPDYARRQVIKLLLEYQLVRGKGRDSYKEKLIRLCKAPQLLKQCLFMTNYRLGKTSQLPFTPMTPKTGFTFNEEEWQNADFLTKSSFKFSSYFQRHSLARACYIFKITPASGHSQRPKTIMLDKNLHFVRPEEVLQVAESSKRFKYFTNNKKKGVLTIDDMMLMRACDAIKHKETLKYMR